jgi:putative SOS response-associated peptidase YedK
LAKLYRLEQTDPIDIRPRLKISPTQTIPIVRTVRGGRRRLDLMRWGLIPPWARDRAIGGKMYNARIETLATKPVFKDALAQRRCLVLADAFYEWKTEGKRKVPYIVRTDDGAPFAMAGLFDAWTSPDGELVESCTIVTREAAGDVATIHTRMPLVLDLDAHDLWLDPNERNTLRLVEFLGASARTSFTIEPIEAVPSDEPRASGQLKLFG